MTNEIKVEFKKARPISGEKMSMFEIELPDGEYEYFHVVCSSKYLFITDSYGAGITAYMERNPWFDLDYDLQLFYELIVNAMANGEEIAGELF